LSCSYVVLMYFFFQAEDGIRDFHVTGVQTCASSDLNAHTLFNLSISLLGTILAAPLARLSGELVPRADDDAAPKYLRSDAIEDRSEERRVGKEGRSRRQTSHEKTITRDDHDETDTIY